MILVIDANIIFSALLNPDGIIATIYFQLSKYSIFLAPDFLQQEIRKHIPRIMSLSGQSFERINNVLDLLYSKILFYPSVIIPTEIDSHAFYLLKGHDEKDIPYLSFALFFQCKLWTGDKPLRTALALKGFDICISTKELLSE